MNWAADAVQLVANPVEAAAHLRIGCDVTNCIADLGRVGRVGSEVPADAERLELGGIEWLVDGCGMATIGTAYHSASVHEPIPACVTNASAALSTAGCGTVARTWTQSGTAPSRSGATLPVAMVSRQPVPSKASIALRYKSIRSVYEEPNASRVSGPSPGGGVQSPGSSRRGSMHGPTKR